MKHSSSLSSFFLLTFAGRVNNEPSVVTVNTTQSSLSHGAVNSGIRKGDSTDVVVPSSSQMSTSSTTFDGQEKKVVNSSSKAHSKPLAPATVPVTTGTATSNNVGDSSRNLIGNARYNKNNSITTTSTSTVNPSFTTTQPKINNNTINTNSNGNNNSHRINNEENTSEVRITNDQQVSCIHKLSFIRLSELSSFETLFLLAC